MYSIFIRNMTVVNSEELCIYSDETVEDKFKVESASLKLQEGNAGSLTLKMPQINVGYNEIETLATQVIVRKDGAVYWFGRVIEVKIDYDNNKEVLCEGALNYLMDTIQPPYHASSSISSWITHLIEAHNTMVVAANEPWKQLVVGYIDPNINPSTNTDLYTNYETTLDMIGNACQGWEAHPLFTYQVDSTTKFPRLVLNFYKTYYLDGDGIPEIIFGENLSDYAKEIKNEDVATVVIPLGKEYTDEERATIQQEWTDHPSDPTEWTEPKPTTDISDLDWKHTIYSVNNQSIYLYDTQDNLNRYGYNCKTVEFSEAIDYAELKAAGEKYLRDQKWDKLTLTLSGYDLSLLDYDRSPIKMGGLVHCLSKPHGLDYNYPCTAIEENLLDATATTYTLGTADNSYITDSSRQTDQKLRDAVTQAVAREKVIQQNSYNYTNGSVTDIYNELEAEIQAISFDPSEAVEEAKTNALQLLNIYDEQKNPEKKGYVHFVKETADYSVEGTLTLSELKTRVNKYFNSANIDSFFDHLSDILNNPLSSTNQDLTIFVLLGPNDYQTAITVWSASTSTYRRTDYDLFFYDYTASGVNYKIATGYNNSNFAYYGYFYSISTNTSYVAWRGYTYATFKYAIHNIADSNGFPNPFGMSNPSAENQHYAYPCKEIFTKAPEGYSAYVSRKIYPSNSSTVEEISPSLKPDLASDALQASILKEKIRAVYSGDKLTAILTAIDAHIDDDGNFTSTSYTGKRKDSDSWIIFVLAEKNNGVINWQRFMVYLYQASVANYQDWGISSNKLGTLRIDSSYYNYAKYAYIFKAKDGQVTVLGNGSPSTSVTFNNNAVDWSSNYLDQSVDYNICTTTLSSANTACFYSMRLRNGSDATYALPNLVSHVLNPQDHITEIVISDKADYIANDANLWRWNKEGLYYLNGGYNSNTLTPNTETHEGYQSVDERLRLALTKDGSIVADRVTAGKLDATVIRTGVIQSQNDNGSALQIAMDTGTILAKKARIVFANSREHANNPSLPDQALNEFAYFSNEPLNRWMNVSGQTSKDWMLVVGSSFGVDKFGRTFMREGHIGGVGGAFDIKAYNDQPIGPRYGSTPIDVGTPIYYEVSISSDAYRPDPVDPVPAQCKFFFRLGYYSAPNTITCVTNIEGFVFEAGTTPEEYEFIFETQEAGVYPYYPGELFPVWYIEGTSTDYDYEEDGEYYKQQTGVNSSYVVEITGYYDSDQETPTMPQYKSWTEERISVSTQNSGTIHIGTGYLDNGNIGQNQSFFLGGITRSGYVAGQGKDNWKFTVGSNFGVDDNGNVYCVGAILRSVNASGTINASYANVGGIPNITLYGKTRLDGQPQFIKFQWKLLNTGSYTTEGDTGIFTSKTAFTVALDPNYSTALGYLPYNPRFRFAVSAEMENQYGGQEPADPKGNFEFLWSRTGTDPQYIIINTVGWNAPPQGTPLVFNGKLDISAELSNQNVDSLILQSQTQIKHYYNEGGATDTMYYATGEILLQIIDNGNYAPAVQISADYLTGSHLGGPNQHWGESWIDNLHSTAASSGSSSKIYKHDIEGLDARYDKLLDILRPVRFRFNKDHYDDGGLYHAGFILEELKDNMDIAGIKPEEFGAYDPNPEGGGGIRYSEFIPLIVDQLQKLKRENEDLKRQLYEKGILDD